MMTARTQSVNVNRLDLIIALKAGREIHIKEYAEATADYKGAVVKFLQDAIARALEGDFSKVKIDFNAPVDHTEDYNDIIDMLEVSVDETINLDRESYKAYYRNEWTWTSSFKSIGAMLKVMNT